jgi:hypothetical protein
MAFTKEEQMAMMDRIPYGSDSPLIVDNCNTYFRKLVAEANKNGDCIINVGRGYYRPIPGKDDEDIDYYFARELHRAREILYKRKRMKAAYKNMSMVQLTMGKELWNGTENR